MRNFHPWHYQKPDIVREHKKARFPLLHIPPDVGVPVAAFPCCRSEHEACQYRAAIAAYDIFHILANGAVIATVVAGLYTRFRRRLAMVGGKNGAGLSVMLVVWGAAGC